MTQIDDLVKMGDRETLYELMTEDDKWLTRLEAAEGLIELGDRRGYEFLISVTMGDDDEMLEVANEILASPVAMKMKRQIEGEQQAERRARIESAKKRLAQGGKVYRYKMVHLPSNALLGEDPFSKGYEVPALDNIGLEGWDVAHVLPIRRAMSAGGSNELFTGVYCLLKKEVLPGEGADLES
jgi:hypothetical protein